MTKLQASCPIPDCGRLVRSNGLCHSHSENLRRHGVAVIIRPTLTERLWMRIDRRGPGECWPWTGSKSTAGYGTVNLGGGQYDYAHRILYRLLAGEIPDGMTIDHACHNRDRTCPGGNLCAHRACMNILHYDPVTQGENLRRARVRLA